jgi:hypothetical protein
MIGHLFGMDVRKEFQVLADQKHMDEPLVHDLKARDRLMTAWIEDVQIKPPQLAGLESSRCMRDIHLKLNAIGNAENQSHATFRTLARVGGTVIWVHWADPITVAVSVGNSLAAQCRGHCSYKSQISAAGHKLLTALS